jgi:hypothetical protein
MTLSGLAIFLLYSHVTYSDKSFTTIFTSRALVMIFYTNCSQDFYVLYIQRWFVSATPQIPQSRRILGLNPGLLRLWYLAVRHPNHSSTVDLIRTRLGLIHTRLDLIPYSTRSHPHSARSHPHSARSHPHSARSHPHSARSHPHLARSHPHSARSHRHLARSPPPSARSHPHLLTPFR